MVPPLHIEAQTLAYLGILYGERSKTCAACVCRVPNALPPDCIQPQVSNLPSIDSLAIMQGNTITRSGYQVVFFQITRNAKHTLKVSGLDDIWNTLPASLQKCRPSLVVLVDDIFLTEHKKVNPQRLEGSADRVLFLETNLDQYLMCLTQAQLWGVKERGESLSAIRP